MRSSRILALAVVTGIIIGLIAFAIWHRSPYERKLADGTILRVTKVKYAKWEKLNLDSLLDQVKAKLPPSLLLYFSKPGLPMGARGSSSWYQNTTMHSNEDALYIYLTRIDAENGGYTSVDFTQVELLDEHDCVFLPTQAGGDDDGRLASMPSAPARPRMGSGHSVGWFRFEAFPRHESKFRLRVFTDETNQFPEFVVVNPAPPPVTANWVTQPLPITNSIGDVSFSLTQVKVKTNAAWQRHNGYNSMPAHLVPEYQIREGGEPSTNWQALESELYDSSGNFASAMYGDLSCLSPREAAWKLRVKFFASESSHAASNTTWTLPRLTVPEHGKFILLQTARDLQGVPIKAIAFAGVGDFVYSNNLPAAIDAADVPQGETSLKTSWNNNRYGSSEVHTLHGRTPHLMLEVGKLSDDQRLTVRARDEQGRQYYAYQLHEYGNNPAPKEPPSKIRYLDRRYDQTLATFLALDLPADAKMVDVTFCIHAATVVDFIFPPPGHDDPAVTAKTP